MFYSVVVPTFSRPAEVSELLESLLNQEYKDFEVIIADGSLDESVKQIVDRFPQLSGLIYLHEKGLGISESRNMGVQQAKGDYVIFFDSDCVIPPGYFTTVEQYLAVHPVDAYGGPDRAAGSFNMRQKAISHAMTSFYTTGGIRGGKNQSATFQPRTFNMGVRRDVFLKLGGFSELKVSEDIDLSMRLKKNGYSIALILDAFVYHKRRTTFGKFFRQVHSFGRGRVDLQVRHGDSLRPVHLLPAIFVLYLVGGLLASLLSRGILAVWLGSLLAYAVLILYDSLSVHKNITVSLLSIFSAFVMLVGYGTGMIRALISRFVLRSGKESEKPASTKEA